MRRDHRNSLLGTMTMTITMEREENSIIQIKTVPYSKIDSLQRDNFLSYTSR